MQNRVGFLAVLSIALYLQCGDGVAKVQPEEKQPGKNSPLPLRRVFARMLDPRSAVVTDGEA